MITCSMFLRFLFHHAWVIFRHLLRINRFFSMQYTQESQYNSKYSSSKGKIYGSDPLNKIAVAVKNSTSSTPADPAQMPWESPDNL